MAITPLIDASDIPEDLAGRVSEETLTLMVNGASAAAYRAAPCLKDSPTDEQFAEARLVVFSAIERWITDGSGMTGRTQAAGPFSETVTPPPQRSSGYRLWPSEIRDLQAICKTGNGLGVIGTYRGDHIPRVRRDWSDDYDTGLLG